MRKIAILLISIVLVFSGTIGVLLVLDSDNISNKDSTPPSITLITPTNNSIISARTIIDLDVSDDDLRFVEYLINNETNELLDRPFDIDTGNWSEGINEIKIVATDEESNRAIKIYTFIKDSIIPTITVSPDDNSVIRPGDIITLNVLDENIYSSNYSINGASIHNFTSQLILDSNDWEDGRYSIIVRSIDKAGNKIINSYNFILSTRPVITLTIGFPQFLRTIDNNSIIYVNETTEFNISSISGNASEIYNLWFRIWNPGHNYLGEGPGPHAAVLVPGGWSDWIEYIDNFTLSEDYMSYGLGVIYDDLHYIEYFCTDVNDQNHSINNISVILDKFGPDTSIEPYGEVNYPTNVNSTTVFNLTAEDWTDVSSSPGVGLNSTWYRIWNASAWTSWIKYTENFTLSGQEGTYYIEYYSIDDFGHIEAIRKAEYNFDPSS